MALLLMYVTASNLILADMNTDQTNDMRQLSFLRNIPRLRVLVLTIRILPEGRPNLQSDHKFDLLFIPGRAFELTPTLEHVDVRLYKSTSFQRCFRPMIGEGDVWLSDEEVSMEEVLDWRL